MNTTDPIADMLTRIRNANSEKFKTVDVPASKMKKAIAETLLEEGIIGNINDGIVILGNGTIDKKLNVKANRFTKSAKEKIQAAGGKIEVI